jgi:RNA polymerase sigma factor (sigma-70 family)
VLELQTDHGPAADDGWLVSEMRSHETSLRAYLAWRFPAIRDVDDIVQESYLRVWRARAAAPIQSIKALFFTVAKHVAHDELRRRVRSPIVRNADVNMLEVAGRPGGEGITDEERIALLVEALDQLPARCREVVVLRKLRQLRQKEVAAMLGISEKGVENQLARGLARCREYFEARGISNFFGEEG